MGSPAKSDEKTMESINNNSHKSNVSHCLGGLPTVFCVMLSVCSMAFCFLVNFRTSHLEYRVQILEMERMSLITSDENGTVPGLPDIIEKLVHEVRLTLKCNKI